MVRILKSCSLVPSPPPHTHSSIRINNFIYCSHVFLLLWVLSSGLRSRRAYWDNNKEILKHSNEVTMGSSLFYNSSNRSQSGDRNSPYIAFACLQISALSPDRVNARENWVSNIPNLLLTYMQGQAPLLILWTNNATFYKKSSSSVFNIIQCTWRNRKQKLELFSTAFPVTMHYNILSILKQAQN